MQEAPESDCATAVDWKAPGAVLLISCYELGHQPMGLAGPMGLLRDRGFRPAALDISIEPLNPRMVRAAAFVGISVPMHTALRLGVTAAARIRELNPDCHLCFYGLYASLNSEYLFAGNADSVVGGASHAPLVDWIESLAAGLGQPPEGVSRQAHVRAPQLSRPPRSVPSREGLPALGRYAQLEAQGQRIRAGYVEATQGCLHQCLHCPITPVWNGRFVAVDQNDVLTDIRAQVELGAGHITFGDPDFLNGPRHSLDIVRKMHKEHPSLTFDMTTKVEHVLRHPSIFPELRDSGCLFVVSAVESLSDEVLRILEKGHTRKDVETALGIVRDAGITLRPTWVAFTPWTSLDDYEQMLEFVQEHDLIDAVDPVQFAVRLLIPPGSALLNAVRGESWLRELDREKLTHVWRHPDPRMDELADEVSSVVERAAKGRGDSAQTFHQIRLLARTKAGLPPPVMPAQVLQPRRMRPPRLTEDWFC